MRRVIVAGQHCGKCDGRNPQCRHIDPVAFGDMRLKEFLERMGKVVGGRWCLTVVPVTGEGGDRREEP